MAVGRITAVVGIKGVVRIQPKRNIPLIPVRDTNAVTRAMYVRALVRARRRVDPLRVRVVMVTGVVVHGLAEAMRGINPVVRLQARQRLVLLRGINVVQRRT